MLRVHGLGLAHRDPEEAGVEQLDVLNDAARPDVAVVADQLGRHAGGGKLFVAEELHRLDARCQVAPQLVDVPRAGEAAGHADDRDVSRAGVGGAAAPDALLDLGER